MEAPAKPKFLLIAVEAAILAQIQKTVTNCEVELVGNADEFYVKYESWQDGMFAEIVIGGEATAELANEAAQIVSSQCPSTRALYITTKRENMTQKTLLKNGISQIFLLPLDSSALQEYLTGRAAGYTGARVYKSVRSLDLKPGSALAFSTYVYLPLNKKFIRYCGENEVLANDKVEKLGKYNVSNLHIEQKDMDKFYKYTAANLRSATNGMSDTEREVKMTESVRQLLFDLFDPSSDGDFDKGKEMIANSQKIVSNFITGGKSNNWYNDLIRALGGTTGGISHAAQVSTFGFLFALALKHPRPEDLALAGFLHDIGMLDVPDGLENRPRATWTPEEVKLWEEHPQRSLNQIKMKKMIITADVEKAILQHHECNNGQGFPKRLPGGKISADAQILSLADQFDELTRVQEGKKRHSPLEALDIIRQNGSLPTELIAKVVKLFPAEVLNASGAAANF